MYASEHGSSLYSAAEIYGVSIRVCNQIERTHSRTLRVHCPARACCGLQSDVVSVRNWECSEVAREPEREHTARLRNCAHASRCQCILTLTTSTSSSRILNTLQIRQHGPRKLKQALCHACGALRHVWPAHRVVRGLRQVRPPTAFPLPSRY